MRNSRTIIRSCALLACATLSRIAIADGPGQPTWVSPDDAKFIYANTASTAPARAATVAGEAGRADWTSDPFSQVYGDGKFIYADVEPAPSPSGTPAASPLEATPVTLMGVLAKTPVGQTLQSAGINIYGWVEGSYEYNFSVRDHTQNSGRAFDAFENNKGYLNQLDLTTERTVDITSNRFDIGGKLDLVYGSDARFTVSSDLLDRQGPVNGSGFGRQEAWFDIHQLYGDLLVPVANGVVVRVGKFEFFKALDPNASSFYTHPYEYGHGFPYTLTGVSLRTPVDKHTTVEGGVSRGWNQTLTDNNNALDCFGRVKFDVSDTTKIILSGIAGPEQYQDSHDVTTALDLTVKYETEKLLIVVDGTFGHQSNAIFGDFPGANTPGSGQPIGAANWYGVNGVAGYKINEFVTLNGRVEWYRDEEGYTFQITDEVTEGVSIGTPTEFRQREGSNLYEITVGVTLMPLHATPVGDNFLVRPEIRYDYSSRDFFHTDSLGFGTRHDQITFAIDAIFNF